jgi:hypothetical protein
MEGVAAGRLQLVMLNRRDKRLAQSRVDRMFSPFSSKDTLAGSYREQQNGKEVLVIWLQAPILRSF